ncbi:hypothetical protein AOC19_02990 [Polynucleobacter asymbioticus]|uniref:hypothetical protein n=1 Tax=Polynucleobacter asymbioticus TaxID=576611 RepID=UPI001BFDAACA|nr:hypothetical protein [Polynucleobacter asymbioticus]QWD85852.1 hypothetical protein AOC19_02990 [Polynucleobacter asymbioticus]
MKTNLLITSLGLIATSVYAQPSVPSVGVPPPTVRAEMPGQGMPSMPQPQMTPTIPNHGGRPPLPSQALPQPMPQMNQSGPQPAVGATGGTGGNGGNGGLIIGTGGTGGAGATPKSANDVKAPASVGVSLNETQARAEAQKAKSEAQDVAQKALARAGASAGTGVHAGNVGATGVTTPMPPLPGNDAKGPTSVGDTGLATLLARGVGPTPLKNDDVGTGFIVTNPPLITTVVVSFTVSRITSKIAEAAAKAQKLEKAAEGPTPVGATGVSTPMPPIPGNDAKGPTSVGVDIDYNDIVMRLVPQI